MNSLLKASFFFVLALLMTNTAFSQDKSKRASPPMTAEGTIGAAKISINYSSPLVKGRTIFGDLVPYDAVWRAGANEATTFETDKNIMVEGKSLPAGKYGLFIIPSKGDWTIIFNSVPDQWGSMGYDSAKDVLRVMVKSSKEEKSAESLMYAVSDKGFTFQWDKTSAMVKIK